VLAGTTEQRICTESNRPGDRLVATLGSAAAGPDGAVLPAGTALVLEVVRVSSDPGRVELLARGATIDGSFVPMVAEVAPLEGQLERREMEKGAGEDRGRVAKGAIAGAIIGQILGRNTRGTVIGGAVGAAAGAATAAANRRFEQCLPSGAPVRVRLVEAMPLGARS
jgi:hypothetical protein